MVKKRIEYIDVLRVLACYLVIFHHSDMPLVREGDAVVRNFYNLISSPSSELFLTISGALLLPTHMRMRKFYSKRFSRLFFPVFFWSCIIILLDVLKNNISPNEGLLQFAMMPVQEVTPAYWFIYVICGLYLVAPIISPWLINSTKKEFQFVILLWLLTIALPFINIAVPDLYHVDGNYYFILNYFGGFLGYMFLGVYLRKYPVLFKNKLTFFLVIVALLLVVILPFLFVSVYDMEFYDMLVYNNLSLFSVASVVMIFLVMQNITFNEYVYEVIRKIANYSFGIYLVHYLVMRNFIWVFFDSREIIMAVETPLISILSFCASFFVVKLITFLPKSKYIVGV